MSQPLYRSLIGGLLLGALCLQSPAQAASYPVSHIIFDNHTDVALHAWIAGVPGKPIPANVSQYPVPYQAVWYACSYMNVMQCCPIEFTDQKNGQKVATVNVRVDNAQVMGSPTIYPPYSDQFRVSGWESVPVQRVSIGRI